MNQIDFVNNEGPRRGRPAVATLETVEQAVEELKVLKKRATVRAVTKIVGGGSPKTISGLLKELPDSILPIHVAPTVPEALTKLWKISVAEYIQPVLEECQSKLEAAFEVIKSKDGDIYDLQARVAELEDLLSITTTERDLALGEGNQLRVDVQQAQEIAAVERDRSEKAELEKMLSRSLVEEMMQRAQVAEVLKDEVEQSNSELRRQLSDSSHEIVRLRGQLDVHLQHQHQHQHQHQQFVVGAVTVPKASAPPGISATRMSPTLDADDSFDDDDIPF